MTEEKLHNKLQDSDYKNSDKKDRSGHQRSQVRFRSCPAQWQLNDRTHAPALDMVSEGGDVDVHVPRRGGLPFVFLLKGLLIVHFALISYANGFCRDLELKPEMVLLSSCAVPG